MILQDIRLARGLSLRSVAKAAGVSPSFMTLLEREASGPSISTAIALCEALKPTPSEADELFAVWSAPARREVEAWDRARLLSSTDQP